jgi:hypothetical protein
MFWFVSYNIFYIRKGWACFSRRTVSFIRLRVQGSVACAWNGTVSYLEDPAGLRTIYSTPLQTLFTPCRYSIWVQYPLPFLGADGLRYYQI